MSAATNLVWLRAPDLAAVLATEVPTLYWDDRDCSKSSAETSILPRNEFKSPARCLDSSDSSKRMVKFSPTTSPLRRAGVLAKDSAVEDFKPIRNLARLRILELSDDDEESDAESPDDPKMKTPAKKATVGLLTTETFRSPMTIPSGIEADRVLGRPLTPDCDSDDSPGESQGNVRPELPEKPIANQEALFEMYQARELALSQWELQVHAAMTKVISSLFNWGDVELAHRLSSRRDVYEVALDTLRCFPEVLSHHAWEASHAKLRLSRMGKENTRVVEHYKADNQSAYNRLRTLVDSTCRKHRILLPDPDIAAVERVRAMITGLESKMRPSD